MAFKMKGAPMHDLSSKHGTNANYKKSGAPGLLGKILDPLGLKNKLMGGNKACPQQAAQAQIGGAKPVEPVTPAAPAAAPAAAAPEEAAAAAAAPMKEGLKKGAPMKASPAKGKMWDALKKGDFKGAGKTLKHELKGIGAGAKEKFVDDPDSLKTKGGRMEMAYDRAKKKSARDQKMKDAKGKKPKTMEERNKGGKKDMFGNPWN